MFLLVDISPNLLFTFDNGKNDFFDGVRFPNFLFEIEFQERKYLSYFYLGLPFFWRSALQTFSMVFMQRKFFPVLFFPTAR